MYENPFKYQGPLDPAEDKFVYVPREIEVIQVINGVMREDYWMILGPRQIGKTTFLHLIKKECKYADCAYITFEVASKNKKKFYQWLVNQLLEKIAHKKSNFKKITGEDPEDNFIDFLKKLRPKGDKIVLLFDEIDRIAFLKDFLHLWRNVYHEGLVNKILKRYVIITTGSKDLLKITRGPNSPFNIAIPFYIKDLTEDECKKIINHLNIEIEENAKQILLSQISGHPQMIQHACHILFETAKDINFNGPLTEKHVKDAISNLLRENLSLRTLEQDIESNVELNDLLIDILKGENIKYRPYKEFSIAGAGPIIEDKNHFCAIRNKVYEKFIVEILQIVPPIKKTVSPSHDYTNPKNNSITPKQDSKVFISYSHDSDEHCENVRVLSDRLIREGLDCILDQYETSPPEGWPMWMANHIRESDFVIIICTETYYRRTINKEKPGKGLGVKWESVLTFTDIYENDSKNKKFIPVLFRPEDEKYRPTPLKGATYYCIDTKEGYETLYRRLTGQPLHKKPPKGKIKIFSPKKTEEVLFTEKPNNKNQTLNTIGNESESEKEDEKSEINDNSKNPYKYKGALDPVNDQFVCIPRTSDLNRVIAGIEKVEYWNILGSRQVGKTTFLRQIQNHFRNEYPFYLDFDMSPETKETFYQWLMDKIRERIPAKEKGIKINEKLDPKNRFMDFLEKFQLREDKKVIFLFDEIEGIAFLKDFLKIWRAIHESRNNIKQFERYTIITAGSTNLVKLTIDKTSPYNVAEDLYLRDFSQQESETLIKVPFNQLKIKIEPGAKQELISQISGHPQMLQHACSKLVNIALSHGRSISGNDVADVLDLISKENYTITILEADLENEPNLQKLANSILKGKANPFSKYQGFSIAGAGCISEDENKCCRFRNQVFKTVIENFFQTSLASIEKDSHVNTDPISKSMQPKQNPKVFISYSHQDKKWKDLLSGHLKVLEPQGTIFAWDDSQIDTGQDWYPEIEQNMNSADAAIFLISKHSLTSKFINSKEIPVLLKRREDEGMIFFPVLVGACVWKRIKWLAKIQIWPRNGIPISKGDTTQRDERCAELVDELYELLKKGTNGDNE